MAKKESYMLKTVLGATDLSITALTGDSLLIKDILIYNPVSNYVTLKTEKTTVGYFRVGGNLGNQLPLSKGSLLHSHAIKHDHTTMTGGSLSQIVDALGVSDTKLGIYEKDSAATEHANAVRYAAIPNLAYESLLGRLGKLGIFKGYPVAEGETFQITGAAQSGSVQIIIYEKYDAADITNIMDNGSAASKYFFINYGRLAATAGSTGDKNFTTPQSPAEFPDFPYAKTVPAKTKVTIYGLLASDIVDDRGGNDTMNSEYIKLVKDRTVLFDESRNGILLRGLIGLTGTAALIGRGVSLIGNNSDVDAKPPIIFPEPIIFNDGEELNVYMTVTAGASYSASGLLVADTEIGIIEFVERI